MFATSPFVSTSLSRDVSLAFTRNTVGKTGILFELKLPESGNIASFNANQNIGINKSVDYLGDQEVLIPGFINPAAIEGVTVFQENGFGGISSTPKMELKRAYKDGQELITMTKYGDNSGGQGEKEVVTFKFNPQSNKFERYDASLQTLPLAA